MSNIVTIEFAETVQRKVTFALTDKQREAIETAGYDPDRPLDVQTWFQFFVDSDDLVDLWSVAGEKEETVTARYVDKVSVHEGANA